MDTVGNKGARVEISAIKVIAPRVACQVIDRAIQVHGGAGVCQDFPLARMYSAARALRIADGPDEVHKMTIARRELRRFEVRQSS
jgi:acyl-CoA dehydrogenase